MLGDELLHWTPGGYDRRLPRGDPGELVEPITPPSLLELLRGGWEGVVPLLHPSAQAHQRLRITNRLVIRPSSTVK